MTPIYILHSEIFSIIFEHAKNMTDDVPLSYESSNGRNRKVPFEIRASSTCSYFRKIALATPRLWTSIHVHGGSHLEGITEMLRRSGDCALDIRIDLALKDPQMDAQKLDPIIEKIIQRSLRWRSLCLGYSCERRDRPMVMQMCSALAPNLQHLSIAVDDVTEADGTMINRRVDLPHIFKDGTPKLRFIRLRGLAIQLFRPPLGTVEVLHLEQIRSIPLQYSTLSNILTHSSYLTHLSIYGDILNLGGWPDEQKIISLPALRSLRVCSISGEAYAGILTCIDAPNLEFLTLKNVQQHDLDSLWNITDKAKFDKLKSLSFIEFDVSATTWKLVFEIFRQITTFSLSNTSAGARESAVIDILSQGTVEALNGRPFVPWPKLGTLRLGSDFYNDQELIDTVITVRKVHGCPISTFMFRHGEDAEEMEGISPLEFGSGVEIRVYGQKFIWPENGTHFDHDDIFFQ